MLRQTQGSLLIVGAIAGGVFLVAFVALLVLGGYGFSPALFLAGLVAAVAAVVLFSGFHKSPAQNRGPQSILERTPAPGSFTPGKTGGPDAGDVPGPAVAPTAAGTAGVEPGSAGTASQPAVETAQRVATETSPDVGGTGDFPDPDTPQQPMGIVAGEQPKGMDGPREGGADDLKKIKGVGPKLEQTLNGMGYYHYSQIAAWGPSEVAWVDENLEGFKGRVSRDNWVRQAEALERGESPDSVDTSYSDDT